MFLSRKPCVVSVPKWHFFSLARAETGARGKLSYGGEAREKTRRGARAVLSLLFLISPFLYGSEVVHFFTFSVDGPRSGRVCVGAGVGREGGARGARLWRVGRRGRGRGRRRTPAASDLQTKGRGGARQGSAAGKAAGLHLGQGGHGRLVEVGAHRSTPRATRRAVTAEIRPTRDGVLLLSCVLSAPEAPVPRERNTKYRHKYGDSAACNPKQIDATLNQCTTAKTAVR